MAPRWTGVSSGVADMPATLFVTEGAADQGRKAAATAGVDVDGDAHPDPQRRLTLGGVDPHADRNPLHYLDPVAGGVLRRQQREFGTARRAEAGDGALPAAAGIAVHPDGRPVARLDIGEIR